MAVPPSLLGLATILRLLGLLVSALAHFCDARAAALDIFGRACAPDFPLSLLLRQTCSADTCSLSLIRTRSGAAAAWAPLGRRGGASRNTHTPSGAAERRRQKVHASCPKSLGAGGHPKWICLPPCDASGHGGANAGRELLGSYTRRTWRAPKFSRSRPKLLKVAERAGFGSNSANSGRIRASQEAYLAKARPIWAKIGRLWAKSCRANRPKSALLSCGGGPSDGPCLRSPSSPSVQRRRSNALPCTE